MDVNEKISELIGLVESARAMPMSASCVVNRAQVLELLDGLRQMLPEQLGDAEQLLREREAVIAEGRREAERIMASARDERGSMIANTDVARDATGEAGRIRDGALREAEQIRAEADDYVDQKLANFEVVLTKTLKAVGRGRDKMRGQQNPMEELGRHVEEQDAADAERDYDRFGADLRRPDREYAGDDRRAGADGSGSGEYEQPLGETSEYHRIAEQPYEPHERHFEEQQAQPYAARSYGGGSGEFSQGEFAGAEYGQGDYGPGQGDFGPGQGEFAPGQGDFGPGDGYGAPAEPAFAEANGYGDRGYGEPDAYPRAYGVPEQANGHLQASVPHQAAGDQSGGYAVPNYPPAGYGVGDYPPHAGVPVPAQDDYTGRTPVDYPADATSYFDTGLIDVRQFRDSYDR